MYQAAATGRMPWRQVPLFVGDRAWLAHLVAAGLLAIELSAPLVLVSRRYRAAFIVLVFALHAGTWLALGLDYWGWILTVAVVLFDWDRHLLASARTDAPVPVADPVGVDAAAFVRTPGGR
jgi:hypothetical protein